MKTRGSNTCVGEGGATYTSLRCVTSTWPSINLMGEKMSQPFFEVFLPSISTYHACVVLFGWSSSFSIWPHGQRDSEKTNYRDLNVIPTHIITSSTGPIWAWLARLREFNVLSRWICGRKFRQDIPCDFRSRFVVQQPIKKCVNLFW